jgi:hypothetical protein
MEQTIHGKIPCCSQLSTFAKSQTIKKNTHTQKIQVLLLLFPNLGPLRLIFHLCHHSRTYEKNQHFYPKSYLWHGANDSNKNPILHSIFHIAKL